MRKSSIHLTLPEIFSKKGPDRGARFLSGGVWHLLCGLSAVEGVWATAALGQVFNCSYSRCHLCLLLLNQESSCCSPRWLHYHFNLLVPSAVSMKEKVSRPSIQITLIIVIYGTLTRRQSLR